LNFILNETQHKTELIRFLCLLKRIECETKKKFQLIIFFDASSMGQNIHQRNSEKKNIIIFFCIERNMIVFTILFWNQTGNFMFISKTKMKFLKEKKNHIEFGR